VQIWSQLYQDGQDGQSGHGSRGHLGAGFSAYLPAATEETPTVVSASAAIESWAVVGAAVVGAAVVGAAVVGAAVVIAAVVGAAVVGAAVAGAIEDDVSTVGASGEEEEEEDDAVGTLQWQFSPSKMFLVTVYPAGWGCQK